MNYFYNLFSDRKLKKAFKLKNLINMKNPLIFGIIRILVIPCDSPHDNINISMIRCA